LTFLKLQIKFVYSYIRIILFRELLVMKNAVIRNKLTDKGLKATPQRIVILEAILKLNNHPAAENIIDYIIKTIQILQQQRYTKSLMLLWKTN
jgi:hypothetical protein